MNIYTLKLYIVNPVLKSIFPFACVFHTTINVNLAWIGCWGRSLSRVLIVGSGNGVGTFDSDRKQPGIKLQMRLPSLFQVALWTKDKWLFVFIVIHLTLQTVMKLEIAISRELFMKSTHWSIRRRVKLNFQGIIS